MRAVSFFPQARDRQILEYEQFFGGGAGSWRGRMHIVKTS